MGIISNIQAKFNKASKQIDKPVSKNDKKKEIKGFKDYASLIGPNAQKRFSLNPELRSKQIKGRVTIAAIAAALAISGGAAIAYNVNSSDKEQAIETRNRFTK